MPLRPYLAGLAGSVCVALTLGGAAPTLAAAPGSALHHAASDWHSGHPDTDSHHHYHHHHHHHHWSHAHHRAAAGATGTTASKTSTGASPSSGGASRTASAQSGSTASASGSGHSSAGTSTGSAGHSTDSGATASIGGKTSTSSSGNSAGSGSAASTGGGALTVGSKVGGYTVAKVLHLTATAYGPSLQDNYPYGPVDAFGKPLVAGDVAVDPNVIPLNTHLYVAGYKSPSLPPGGEMAVARDTGGAIHGARIDIFINGNAQQVSNFGVQPVTVYVLK